MEQSEFIKVRGRNFFCHLCDIKITSEKAVNDHLAGKKHQRQLSFRDSRHEQVQRSIFVGGLSRLNGELELGDYFSKFGEVAQIIIDKEKAHYAIVEFASRESATSATEVEKQLMNGRKIVVRARQPKAAQPQSKGSGRSRSKQAGKGGSGKEKSSPQEPQLDKALHERLQHEETVSGQMSALVQLTELSQADQRLRGLICDLLQGVLEEFLPGCLVSPFGSSVNGFGIQGCDLDIQLGLRETSSTGFTSVDQDEESLQNQSSSLDDQATLDIASATPLDILTLVSDVIKRCVPSCHNVHIIPSARLPVVKFTHKESGLHCDISLNNRLALRNTKLLQFYSELDSRVRPLVFTVRHWAKLRQLAGNVGAGPRLTNYALTLMVMFYLQARDEPMIPSVAELNCSGDGSDSVFSTCTSLSTTENKETQEDLLAGFFRFYDRFDFTTTAICPLPGKATSLSEALQSAEGCDDSGRAFKTGAVNIQDPFELWHNVALNVNEKTAERLSAEFAIAAELCRSEQVQRGRRSEEDKSWGLLALFDPANHSAPKTLPPTNSPSVSSTGSTSDGTRIEINLKSSHLSEGFIGEHPEPTDLKSAWCKAVRLLAYRILSETLRFECCWSSDQDTSDAVKESDNNTEATTEELHKAQTIDRNLLTPGTLKENQILESASARTDSPGEGDVHSDDSDRKISEPPSKRCRVDPCEDAMQSPISLANLTGDANQKVKTSAVNAHTWCSEMGILECTVYHRVWLGRRKARRQLQLKHRSQEGRKTQPQPSDLKQSSMAKGDTMNSTPKISLEAAAILSQALDEEVTTPSASGCNLAKPIEKNGSCQGSSNEMNLSDAPQSKDKTCDSKTGSQLSHDSLVLESQVTDLIVSDKLPGSSGLASPILKFSVHLRDNITQGSTRIIMDFLPDIGDADFKVFLHFFDIFFKKMLDQCKI